MIKDLRYAVTFPTNGVSLSGQLSFQPGATAIVGDNGVGKSFIAEMIRYGLFGKRALRGPASDYKTLDMALTFLGYRVERGKKEFLYDAEGEQLAVGADAVNKKIVDLLGFDLEVFDVVCAANQKESERLTRLTPAKRKELIDNVVGLTRQEAVEKACRDEAKEARIEAEALTRTLVTPVEPEKPEGYRPSAEVKAELDETIEVLAQRVELQRIIDAVPAEPTKPLLPRPDIAELEAHETARVQRDAQRAALERQIANIPDAQLNAQQLADAEAIAQYEAELGRRGERPQYAKRQLEEWQEVWADKALLNYKDVTCPNCQHHFIVGWEDFDIEAIKALPEPPLSAQEIACDLKRHENWPDELKKPPGRPLDPRVIQNARVALARAGEKVNLQHELAELTLLDDRSAELADARRLDREWDIYENQASHYAACAAEAGDAQYELDKLAVPANTPEDLNAAYTAAVVYEQQLARYEADKERFDALSKEIAEKQERSEAFTAGAKGLVEARRTLKAFLAPSLSRVASKIIRQMTERSLRPLSDVVVDEDMNITADGQDVSTFNGAHATMINLALRLALGQVLVARVFPVFLGDEIDSDATPANAQAIADGLMACKEQVKQIVLISHKRLEGVDHEVLLG